MVLNAAQTLPSACPSDSVPLGWCVTAVGQGSGRTESPGAAGDARAAVVPAGAAGARPRAGARKEHPRRLPPGKCRSRGVRPYVITLGRGESA